MNEIEVLYAAGDRLLVDVRGHDFVVDQPSQSGGDDAGPTPTELFIASLATCIGFYAERFLRRHERTPQGLRVLAGYEMSTARPARVASIDVRLMVPEGTPASLRPALRAVVEHCTVHNTLSEPPSVRIDIEERVPVGA